jgi:hypothetical protein
MAFRMSYAQQFVIPYYLVIYISILSNCHFRVLYREDSRQNMANLLV